MTGSTRRWSTLPWLVLAIPLAVSAATWGVQGIGYSRRVAPPAVTPLVLTMRAQGDSTFHVWPEGARAGYHAILLWLPAAAHAASPTRATPELAERA